jgi:AcrR family transcriptional regulator
MEAARSNPPRELTGERAQRIIDAMRASVARRGAAGSTFDHVAREAGVSRGLLHYYFGTKERLLVEVVRRDSDIRMEALDRSLADAHTADDFIDVLVAQLEDLVTNDPGFIALHFELFTSARRNPDVAAEMAELQRRTRAHVAELLARKQQEGVLHLHDEPEAIATVLFSLADGLALRMLIEPDDDFGPALRAGVAATRALLTDDA